MRDRLRLPLRFDAAALRADLERLDADGWTPHFVPEHYDGAWTVLPLRTAANARHDVAAIYSDPAATEFVDTPLLARCPALAGVLRAFECPVGSARLMKLTPGSIIRPHRDHDLAPELGRARLHVPVATNAGVDFRLNGRRVVMAEGECWFLRLSDEHAVANRGDTDRVHLVIDVVVNDWLRALFETAEPAQADVVSEVREQETPLASLRNAIVHDAELQRSLSGIADRTEFIAAISGLAAARGHPLQAREAEHAMRSVMRRLSSEALLDDSAELDGWIPFHVESRSDEPAVYWCHAGRERFTDPFFEQTVRRCLRTPFNQLFASVTSVDALVRRAHTNPGIAPGAFIFHVSRCGSTLFSQLAAALPRTIVVSEAAPIDHVLQSDVDEETRVVWLRALLAALGQPRCGDERHLFVKFDAWHVVHLALIRRAFPGVPCVFLYRDPAEVVASQMRMPGLHVVPGMSPFSPPELDRESALTMPREEYVARVLGTLYAAAVPAARAGELLLLRYDELPARAASLLLDWCGLREDDALRARFEEVSSRDAKTPSLPFSPSDGNARRAGSEASVAAAERFIGASYAHLESLRMTPPAK